MQPKPPAPGPRRTGRRLSLAEAHFARTMAAATGTPAAASRRSEARDLYAAALWNHRRELKAIKSVREKIARKRAVLPDYAPYVSGALAARSGEPDDILLTVMVWRLDTRDLAGALDIAAYAIAAGLRVPDSYARDTPALVAEQVAEEVLAALAEADAARHLAPADGAAEAPVDAVPSAAEAIAQAAALADSCRRAWELTDGHDMHDAIRAKLRKAWGYAERAAGRDRAAVPHLRDALALNPRVGVKKDLERLEARIAKAAA